MRTQFFTTMAAMVAVAVNATRLESSDLIEYDPITFAETSALAEVPANTDIDNEADLDSDSDAEGEGNPAQCNKKCGRQPPSMAMHCFKHCM